MKINTRKFGEIEIDEKKILTMPEGLPGFPGFAKFVLLEDPKSKPFCWYQSVEGPNLALAVISPFVFKPDYTMDLKSVIDSRNWTGVQEESLVIYVVVNVSHREGIKKVTANLIGPIVINPGTNEAVQVVLSDMSYSHQFDILAAFKEAEANVK